MANTPLPDQDSTVTSSRGLTETLQQPRLRLGGPSSSQTINDMMDRAKRDISRLAVDVTDSAYQSLLLAQMIQQQNAGLQRAYGALHSQVSGLTAITGSGLHKALADFSLCERVVNDPSLTTADVNPLFGQATLPARTRQNCLVIERGGGEPPAVPGDAGLLVSLQPSVTDTAGATSPADYTYGEDPESVCALDGSDLTPWIVPDPTLTPHLAWVEIRMPGGVSGAYRCNELEFVPACPFALSLISVQAEVIGQGWRSVDFSYLTGYDAASRSVIGLGPARLCFTQTSVRRFRLGLWVPGGPWGFSRVRALQASYVPSASVTVDFSAYSPGPLVATALVGKDAQALGYLTTTVAGSQVTATLAPASSSAETCLLTGIAAAW